VRRWHPGGVVSCNAWITQHVPGDEPLAFLHKRAIEAAFPERVKLLKDLGDVALYVAGFFADFIERSLVDIDYYVSMGCNAYGSLSEIVGARRHGEAFAQIYRQLARRFSQFVDLLTEIAERTRTGIDDHVALLKLYDRWARTKSQRIHKLLLDKGLLPTEGLPTEYNQ